MVETWSIQPWRFRGLRNEMSTFGIIGSDMRQTKYLDKIN